MKRFLSTTAVVLAMTAGTAYAESHANADAGMMTKVEFKQGDFYASDLIGMRIYNSEAEVENEAEVADGAEKEWDDIGEVNDVILSADGEVKGVILGVGGFLGVGERDVVISMDDIKILNEEGESDDRFLVVNTSKEALEQQPEYEREAEAMKDDAATETAAVTNEAEGEMNEAEAEMEKAGNEIESETEQAAAEVESEAEQAEAEVEQELNQAEAEVESEMNEGEAMAENELKRPEATREGYAEAKMADVQKLAADDIEGSYVYGANDETVGEIDALLLDGEGKITEAVINVGGFLGIGEKPVAVSFDKIQVLQSEDGDDFRFYIDSTEEKLESMQEYEQ